MAQSAKPRVIGFNHVALEVGDIEEALAFYGRLFEFELRGKSDTMAFIDLGDQFIALQKGRKQPPFGPHLYTAAATPSPPGVRSDNAGRPSFRLFTCAPEHRLPLGLRRETVTRPPTQAA